MGRLFDIKRFATGDGPGIRALVFLKGCPLACAWCANPESQRTEPEVLFHRDRCVGCGRCVAVCPTGAIAMDPAVGLATDLTKCTACGCCVAACLHEAREKVGEDWSVDEVMELLERDRRYYDNSGGGITLTGGEPLFQPEFSAALLGACKREGLHTALETSGFADWEAMELVLEHVDLLYYDLKHPEPRAHQAGTGQSNVPVLRNLVRIRETFSGDLIVRIPYVPGFNDDPDAQRKMIEMASRVPGIRRVEILPYHRLGLTKYAALGRACSVASLAPVDKRSLEGLRELGVNQGIEVEIDAR
jgi:pyruvate formate lyase activating enzyme